MSLVIYTGNTLAVDRSGCNIDKHRPNETAMSPTEVNKFHLTADKRIAIAYTGPEVDFNSTLFKDQVSIFRRVLKAANGGADGVDLSVYLHKQYVKVIFFVMTANACFEVITTDEEPKTPEYAAAKLVALDKNHPTFHGTGQSAAAYACSSSIDVNINRLPKLFKIAADFTEGMWRTEVDMVSHSDLKPF